MLDRHTPGATLVAAASLGTPQPWAILGGVEFWPATPNPYPTMAAYEARIGNYLVTVASPSGREAQVTILAQAVGGTVNLKLDTPMDGVAPSAFYIDALAGLY